MFQPGQSGNPSGRPKGSINKQLHALREAVEQVLPVVVERALAGDIEAQKIILERGLPKLKPVSAPESISLPPGSLLEQVRALLQQVAAGDITAGAAEEMLQLLASATQLMATAKKAGLQVEPTPPPAFTGNAYVQLLQRNAWEEQQRKQLSLGSGFGDGFG